MSYTAHDAALEFTDRLLAACGGGSYLVIGPDVSALTRALRWRGVTTTAHPLDAATFEAGTLDLLGIFDVIVLDAALDGLPPDRLDAAIDVLRHLKPRALVVTAAGEREEWERKFIARDWRKHPLHQVLVDCDHCHQGGATLLVEPLPAKAKIGRSLRDLARESSQRMDMLREAGARADAHVARYHYARTFVRPGDRVLDAACGLGYGSAILADGTLAESVLGVDLKEFAVGYATEHYAAGRKRLSFQARDLTAVSVSCRCSFDVITCFETLDQLTSPAKFLAECNRVLTPGGRLICSIPAKWLEEGPALEQMCAPFFEIEHLIDKGGSKVLVAMTDPFAARNLEFRHGQLSTPVSDHTNLLAYERDYERPWLLQSMVSIGIRTESPEVLDRLSGRTLTTSAPTSADYGAGLCVSAYQQLKRSQAVDADLMQRIETFCAQPAANPHAFRWQIGLRYVQGLAYLEQGQMDDARRALEQCATSDPLRFNPVVATKVVASAFVLGWIALQAGDLERARSWWTAGISTAERAIQRPWEELLVNWASPVIFGLREATHIIDLASKCATGLHLLPHAVERPGLVASELQNTMGRRIEQFERTSRRLADVATRLESAASDAKLELRQANAEAARLKSQLRATALFNGSEAEIPQRLKIAIFGCGKLGQRTLKMLRERGATVECFADNNAVKWYETIDGVPIVAPAALRAKRIDVIAVASSTGRDAIFAQLARLGYQHGHDYDAVAA